MFNGILGCAGGDSNGGGTKNNAAAGGVTFEEGELTSNFENQLSPPPTVATITQQQRGAGLTSIPPE